MDTIFGGPGDDMIGGQGSNDMLYGGGDDDKMNGWIRGIWSGDAVITPAEWRKGKR